MKTKRKTNIGAEPSIQKKTKEMKKEQGAYYFLVESTHNNNRFLLEQQTGKGGP
jgi:hypothetical protein